jgi:prepilin-type N-terminal cleavage/methylation domain-containing protein
MIFSRNKGQTLLEILIGVAVLGIIASPTISSLINTGRTTLKYNHQIRATQYAREGLEVAYNLAVNSDNWQELVDLTENPAATYYPTLTPGGFSTLAEGIETLEDQFYRAIFIQKAKRDTNGNLDEENGQEDPNTLRVITRVLWQEGQTNQVVKLETYLINFPALENGLF